MPPGEIHKEDSHFICHHAVIHNNHDTTKVRIVFDGSAKSGKSVLSLNERLRIGNNTLPHLFDNMLRFHSHSIALTADIEKAFLQIEINEADRDCLCFLWFDDVNKPNPDIIQMRCKVLLFGLSPSPNILSTVIQRHISAYKTDYPQAVQALSKMYVDDMSCGADSVEEGFELYQTSKKIMSQGGFNLRKWKTNDKMLMSKISEIESPIPSNDVSPPPNEASKICEDDQSYTTHSLGLPISDAASKSLGVQWGTEFDKLYFEFPQVVQLTRELPPTKRSVLKLAAKIFDPLGCLSVYTINLKALFQQLCIEKIGWDVELQGHYRELYDRYISKLSTFQSVSIDRCLFTKGKIISNIQLHGFSGDSECAHGCVIYLRTEYTSGEVSVKFVASKAKISPIKRQSIPRLELMGANLLARLMETVRATLTEELVSIPISAYYWVDSVATLCWIRNHKFWKQFVRHRVSDILQLSERDEWLYCLGTQNPADLPSRGTFSNNFAHNRFWWEELDFLKLPPTEWPNQIPTSDIESNIALQEAAKNPKNVRHVVVSMQDNPFNVDNVIDTTRFSTKNKALRVIAWLRRFVNNLKSAGNHETLNKAALSAVEMQEPEITLSKSIQNQQRN